MKTLSKYAVAAALTGALVLAAATPSQARWYGHGGWHNGGAAAAIGFGAGALVGAAVAGGAYPGYDGYDDGAGYAYAPGPYETYGEDSYAYAPGPDSYAYAPGRYTGYRLHQDRSCGQSPASINYTSCD
jgi:hypothetical protein